MVVNKSLTKVFNSNLLTETPNYLKKDAIYKKFGDLNRWYTKLIGLDEVKMYQDRVVNLQEKLLLTQERRRELSAVLDAVRLKSNDLQDQLIKVKREDYEQFLALIKEESTTLKKERDVTRMFAACDQEEREIFTAFSNAIRDSHEKQRAQLEYTKYFGLIISVTGSFLAFVYSSLKKNDLKRFIETVSVDSTSVGALTVAIQRNSEENDQKIKEMYKYVDKDNQKMLSIIAKNHQETKALLSKVASRGGNNFASYIDAGAKSLNELPDERRGKILWYGLLTLAGLFVIGRIMG